MTKDTRMAHLNLSFIRFECKPSDVITDAKFHVNRFMGLWVLKPPNLHTPLAKLVALTAV